ncbi:ABC transporter permease [bacterium]|nr:ABC transporter permease [candidate division CSSED10-310 bacterium]
MDLRQSVRIGLIELRSNKLGSFLTMLGVIFGVAAVIASVAIGAGAREQAMEQIAQLGITNIRVRPLVLEGQERVSADQQNPDGLSLVDVKAIAANCPFAHRIAPIREITATPRVAGRTINGTLLAVTPDYRFIVNFHPVRGRFIADLDMNAAEKVCVLGAEVAEDVFGDAVWETISGQWIQIGMDIFRVIGVMEDKRSVSTRASTISVRNINRDIYIPFSVAEKRLRGVNGESALTELIIDIRQRRDVRQAADLIGTILDRTHGGVRDFELVVPLDLLRQAQATQRRFNMVLAAIAAISLLVGGIGIMNIMLASVTQRTREIGIRRALGATRRDIQTQFLLEAVILSLVGGIIGIFAGVILGAIIAHYAGWNTVFSFKAIILSVLVAATVGVAAGLFPARRAAGLHPIEALRYE